MRLLLLLLAMQSQPGVRATAADSVAARAELTRALATLDSVGESASQREGMRLLTQMHLWGMVESGTRTAFRLDSTSSRPERPSYWFIQRWAVERALIGDTVTVEAMLETAPAPVREEIVLAVARDLRFARPDLATRYGARLTRPTAKADYLRHMAGAARSRGDTAEARRLLEEALRVTLADPKGGWEPMYSIYQLLELGADVRLADLLGAADKATDDWWTGRTEVARALLRSKRTEQAKVVIDSLAANIETQPPARRPSSRTMLHQLRGTAADSAIARFIQDSLAKAFELVSPPAQQNLDWRITSLRDTLALIELLSRDGLEDRVVLQLVYNIRALVTLPVNPYRGPAVFDSLRPFVRVGIERLPRAIDKYQTMVRDSILAFHVAAVAFVDVDRAFTIARGMETPRFRQRALAEIAARLVRIDADSAFRVAATLNDSVAKAVAFGPLASAATSGARLTMAAELAGRATGDARVRAFFELATKERENNLLASARQHVAIALNSLNPIARCDGCLIVHTTPPPGPIILPTGTDARLIADVVHLAVQLDLREQLARWASSRGDQRGRAMARLVIAEAMSRHLLGWHQPFPMH